MNDTPAAEPEIPCPFCAGTGRARTVDGECNACFGTPGRTTASYAAQHREHLAGLAKRRAARDRGRR